MFDFPENQNLEMSIGTFSMCRIRPYGHIRTEITFFADLGVLGILPYFIPYIYSYRPCLGSLAGVMFVRMNNVHYLVILLFVRTHVVIDHALTDFEQSSKFSSCHAI